MIINHNTYDFSVKTYIMGIINITPDSFSNDGLYSQTNYIDAALEQAQQMINVGADFIDIGAESTRPGAAKVEDFDEAKRLLPVIQELTKSINIPISVDTYKWQIAEAAIDSGALIINDIWGLQYPDDPEHRMAKVIAEAKVPIIIMHNKMIPQYQNLMPELLKSLSFSMEIAIQAGVSNESTILDPGIGFGKTLQHNLIVLHNMEQLNEFHRPVLLGTSRKSVIGLTLDLPVDQRLEGTIATCVWGIMKGVSILRVHDVQAVSRAVKMIDAIKNNNGDITNE